ncbi:hypothetical protein R1flu_027653 [Riccia fluitans]|uniref:Hflx-type G domain-containing protein n=1 Tax=Riccia fluitans TaxID=41844 RepID=A0ABD1XJE7_9MARC
MENCLELRRQNTFHTREISRCRMATSYSTCHLYPHGLSARAHLYRHGNPTGSAARYSEHVWSPLGSVRESSRNRVFQSVYKGGIILSCSPADKFVSLSFDEADDNWSNKDRDVSEHRLFSETGPSSTRNRESAFENVNNFLHVEDTPADSEENEYRSADGWLQFYNRGDSGSSVEEKSWWETEPVEEGNARPAALVGTQEREKDDSARFRIRNGREVYGERTYLVGIDCKGAGKRSLFSIKDSLQELGQLADTAGLVVVGSTYQKLVNPNPKTYIGIGKVAEIQAAIRAFEVETIIFDDELSPGQLRNLEKAFEGDVRVCDRTALILDIFNQRAATREARLQVELAQFEYQLPRLTRMWTHLERQAGGMVKGMGEKQIEVDKRILRTRISALKTQLESVRDHRQQYRDRRAAVPIPVVSLVGYTNAGKSTFLNRLSGANVLAEDRLFATLDPTTRRVQLSNGKECLFTDTVGFIQKLPTQLVAAFRATLEEITDSSLLVHVVDISHPMAQQQVSAVKSVLADLDVHHIPLLTVWNKIDKAEKPGKLRDEAAAVEDTICVSALTGEGIGSFDDAVQRKLKDLMVWVEVVIPYDQGDLISIIHRLGIVDEEAYIEQGTLIRAHVPLALSRKMSHLRQVPM